MRFCGMSTISPRRPCRRWGVVSGGISPIFPAISSSVLHIRFPLVEVPFYHFALPITNQAPQLQPHPTPLHHLKPLPSPLLPPQKPPNYQPPPPYFLPKTTNPHTHPTRPFQTHHRRVFERKQTNFFLNGFVIGRS